MTIPKSSRKIDVNSSRQRPWQFAPGNKGRPVGSRGRVTLAVEALLEGEAEALGRKAVEVALGGDVTAIKLCLDRIAPVRRGRPTPLQLPKLKSVSDVSKALSIVLAAMADGTLTAEEASGFCMLLDAARLGLETAELEGRIKFLEDLRHK